jgi:hypothetical protein
MPKVIVQKWEESERGWGTRPDGYSIHKSRDDLRQYLADEWAAEKQRNPSGVTPDEYTRTSGTPYEAEVDEETFDKIGDRRGLRVFDKVPGQRRQRRMGYGAAMIDAWTDYPIAALGDEPYKDAPIRKVRVLAYDRNKYCAVEVGGFRISIKAGYLYTRPARAIEAPRLPREALDALPERA